MGIEHQIQRCKTQEPGNRRWEGGWAGAGEQYKGIQPYWYVLFMTLGCGCRVLIILFLNFLSGWNILRNFLLKKKNVEIQTKIKDPLVFHRSARTWYACVWVCVCVSMHVCRVSGGRWGTVGVESSGKDLRIDCSHIAGSWEVSGLNTYSGKVLYLLYVTM